MKFSYVIFDTPKRLVYFINQKNITKEQIVQIIYYDNYITLYYYA